MERRFLAEHMETNLLIKNTLDSSLKSFNDSILFNMNLLMQQRLPPSVQPPPRPPTAVMQPHPKVLAPVVPALEAAISVNPMLVPMPLPPKAPPPISQPLSTKGWQ